MLIRPHILLLLTGGMVILSSCQPTFGDGVRMNGHLKIVFLRKRGLRYLHTILYCYMYLEWKRYKRACSPWCLCEDLTLEIESNRSSDSVLAAQSPSPSCCRQHGHLRSVQPWEASLCLLDAPLSVRLPTTRTTLTRLVSSVFIDGCRYNCTVCLRTTPSCVALLNSIFIQWSGENSWHRQDYR